MANAKLMVNGKWSMVNASNVSEKYWVLRTQLTSLLHIMAMLARKDLPGSFWKLFQTFFSALYL